MISEQRWSVAGSWSGTWEPTSGTANRKWGEQTGNDVWLLKAEPAPGDTPLQQGHVS